ncbi:probable serine/threonine-protein kinase At1g01540 [Rutidosis leptorrhynchoides]|uniref:probable serine/threonine-protein kinase At1g01540 n=1 Tax=Rutidosis leptorrhynchoides TaxID=125765 RepID=UPI003A9A1BF5
MSIFDKSFINNELSKPTSIFGLPLRTVVGIFVGAIIVLFLFLLSICITSRRRHTNSGKKSIKPLTPTKSKEIQEIVHRESSAAAVDHRMSVPEIQIDIGKSEHRVVFSDRQSSGESRATSNDTASHGGGGSNGGYPSLPQVSHLGWGRWYTLRELEAATNGLDDGNVIGEGGYGIVYSGILEDNTRVAVKNLLNNRGQAEREFKVEVEAIGRVRHKNLVRLLGYCVEGAYRMLVYEYVDNGNLDQWLHGDVGDVSPLTWSIRMNIIQGTAKGLAYLHEGLEPKVVHRDIKSSNILLDRQWNSKVSDFGLAKLLGSDTSYVTTRVMGTFGYVAPEYACTGMLTEKSDVYSFGILIMEIITGRNPVDYGRSQGEVNLVEWLKTMVGNRKSDEVVDPKLPEMPSSKALKRILLVALRCVDPDAQKRPKMGHVLHMLEADDLLFPSERREPSRSNRDFKVDNNNNNNNNNNNRINDKQSVERDYDTSEGGDSSRNHRWR